MNRIAHIAHQLRQSMALLSLWQPSQIDEDDGLVAILRGDGADVRPAPSPDAFRAFYDARRGECAYAHIDPVEVSAPGAQEYYYLVAEALVDALAAKRGDAGYIEARPGDRLYPQYCGTDCCVAQQVASEVGELPEDDDQPDDAVYTVRDGHVITYGVIRALQAIP